VMQHVVNVESSRNPFAIGVVGGYLAKQPGNLEEALSAVRQLKAEGYNFSVGIAQVNRYNLAKYGLPDYASAFQACPNLRAGSRILRECYDRAQDWGKAFSCYYSGNFVTGFDHGYVQKIFASIRKAQYAVQDAPRAVRIIPYNSKLPRKIARDDGLPIEDPRAAIRSPAHPASAIERTYPEPYAIRRYLPSTPLDLTANALAQASSMSTAESRAAIPVPGPGALMPVSESSQQSAVTRIPIQVVGVGGDPYRTEMLDVKPKPNMSENLPLPIPEGGIEARSESSGPQMVRRHKGLEAKKGGQLLHHSDLKSESEQFGPRSSDAFGAKTEPPKAQSRDQSFVF
jgi:type IV secretion system protein VirB1